jgi:uncharacterized protein YndB with AHSA1/START domain
MSKGIIARAEITINVPPSKVWQALTDPELVKQYFFGTTVKSNWKEGSPVTYTGEWEGKAYEDKGTVLKVEPEKLLVSSYWSSISGVPDSAENYNEIAYELTEVDGGTRLKITQDNNRNEESARHSEQNWNMVLEGMKKLLEK